MQMNQLNLPASIVKTVNGKKFMLNGTLLSVNESTGTCKMQIGRNIKNVPLENVYLNEGLLDTIKDFGKKAWNKIKGVVKLAKGFVVPVDDNGRRLFEFFNIPVNLLGMKLKPIIRISPAEETYQQAMSNGLNVVNNKSIEDAFAASNIAEADAANKYWGQVMKEYAKNESMNISQTIKYVNEKYYRPTNISKVLNEAALDTIRSKGNLYGVQMGTRALKDRLIKNIYAQIETEGGSTAMIVWGAPGIGKSAVISQIAKDIKAKGKYDLNTIVVQSGALHSDDFTLPGTATNAAGMTVAQDIAKTWLPVYSKTLKTELPEEEWRRIDDLYNSGHYGLVYSLPDRKVTDKNGEQREVAYILPTKVDANGNIYKTGGILFFDEIARMADKQTQTVVMNLVADRKYGNDMILATRWAIVAAANRRSDDGLPEFDKLGDGIDAMRIPAVASRYLSVTYVPKLEDWLTWARSPRSETDDRQNILEVFCEFVERMGEKAIYDCIDYGGHSATREEQDKISKATAGLIGNETDKRSKDDLMFDIMNELEEYQSEHNQFRNAQLSTFNFRSMERNISNYVELELKMLFEDVPGGFEKCWERIKHIDKRTGKETYTRTISKRLLKQQLKEIDRDTWMEWCDIHAVDQTKGEGEQWSGWKSDARGDRYAFLMKWLSYNVFPTVAGPGSVQANLWKSWNEYGKTMTTEAIQNIWRYGYISASDTTLGAEDLLYFVNPNEYMQYENISWKQSTEYVKHVIKDLLSTEYYYGNAYADNEDEKPSYEYGTDCFNDNLAAEIKKIAKIVKSNGNKIPTMSNDVIDKWRKHFAYTLYTLHDGETTPTLDQKHEGPSYTPLMRNVKGLVSDKVKLERLNDTNNKYAFILENSSVAEQLGNVAKYFHQVAKQTNTSTINNTESMVEEFFNFSISDPLSDKTLKYVKDAELQNAIKFLNDQDIVIQSVALTIIQNISRS